MKSQPIWFLSQYGIIIYLKLSAVLPIPFAVVFMISNQCLPQRTGHVRGSVLGEFILIQPSTLAPLFLEQATQDVLSISCVVTKSFVFKVEATV